MFAFPLTVQHAADTPTVILNEMMIPFGSRTGIFLPCLLGAFISSICMGIILCLGHHCFQFLTEKESLRWLVVLVVIAQAVETGIDISHQCLLLAVNWGDPDYLKKVTAGTFISPIIATSLQCQAQLFLLWRSWQFSRFLKLNRFFFVYLLIGLGAIMIVVSALAGIIASVGFNLDGFGFAGQLGNFWQYSSLVIDLGLCVFLLAEIYFTRRDIVEFKKSSAVLQILNRLCFLLIASGIVTLAIQSWTSALWAYERATDSQFERWSALPLSFLSKAYTLSFLVILANCSSSTSTSSCPQATGQVSCPKSTVSTSLASNSTHGFRPWDSTSSASQLMSTTSNRSRSRAHSSTKSVSLSMNGAEKKLSSSTKHSPPSPQHDAAEPRPSLSEDRSAGTLKGNVPSRTSEPGTISAPPPIRRREGDGSVATPLSFRNGPRRTNPS
ncbi:hypothetical protein BT69DRAFT_410695 [Atractiella rhizophila]|nr:hypothetical protein BT69DRAFT_410695 [Atractiella rhizophila]